MPPEHPFIQILPLGTDVYMDFEQRAARSLHLCQTLLFPSSITQSSFVPQILPFQAPMHPLCWLLTAGAEQTGHGAQPFPEAGFQVRMFMCCQINLVLRAGVSPATESANLSVPGCPHCKQCSKSNPRESRLRVSMAGHSWEAGCLFQRTNTDLGTPRWGHLDPVSKMRFMGSFPNDPTLRFGGLHSVLPFPTLSLGR